MEDRSIGLWSDSCGSMKRTELKRHRGEWPDSLSQVQAKAWSDHPNSTESFPRGTPLSYPLQPGQIVERQPQSTPSVRLMFSWLPFWHRRTCENLSLEHLRIDTLMLPFEWTLPVQAEATERPFQASHVIAPLVATGHGDGREHPFFSFNFYVFGLIALIYFIICIFKCCFTVFDCLLPWRSYVGWKGGVKVLEINKCRLCPVLPRKTINDRFIKWVEAIPRNVIQLSVQLKNFDHVLIRYGMPYHLQKGSHVTRGLELALSPILNFKDRGFIFHIIHKVLD